LCEKSVGTFSDWDGKMRGEESRDGTRVPSATRVRRILGNRAAGGEHDIWKNFTRSMDPACNGQ
jgi:hypothetical protein